MEKNKKIKIWYDRKADFLEVIFEKKPGIFRETSDDSVMEKIDKEGNVIGFSIIKLSNITQNKSLSVTLKHRVA